MNILVIGRDSLECLAHLMDRLKHSTMRCTSIISEVNGYLHELPWDGVLIDWVMPARLTADSPVRLVQVGPQIALNALTCKVPHIGLILPKDPDLQAIQKELMAPCENLISQSKITLIHPKVEERDHEIFGFIHHIEELLEERVKGKKSRPPYMKS